MCVCVRLCVCVCVCARACVLSHFSCVWLFVTLCTVAHQASLFMGFSRQEYWSGLPCPSPGDLPNPGIEPKFLMSPALADGLFTPSATWEIITVKRAQGPFMPGLWVLKLGGGLRVLNSSFSLEHGILQGSNKWRIHLPLLSSHHVNQTHYPGKRLEIPLTRHKMNDLVLKT